MKTNTPTTYVPLPPSRVTTTSGYSPMFPIKGLISTLHFLVHPEMPEVQAEAEKRGWNTQGFTNVSIDWLHLHWSADGWKTCHVVSSTDVPCPVVNGTFHLAGCAPDTEVEFAIHVGIGCHATQDTAGCRDTSDLWLNNENQNFRQATR